MWKNGSTANTTSLPWEATDEAHCSMLFTRLAWVSITPLGNPVVPDE